MTLYVCTGGIALAAIQGLHEIVQEKEEEISSLKARVAALEQTIAAISQKALQKPKGQ